MLPAAALTQWCSYIRGLGLGVYKGLQVSNRQLLHDPFLGSGQATMLLWGATRTDASVQPAGCYMYVAVNVPLHC
jgi:hypothetical protein